MRCPRCNGNVAASREDDGLEYYCLACGWRPPFKDVITTRLYQAVVAGSKRPHRCRRCGNWPNSNLHKQACRSAVA